VDPRRYLPTFEGPNVRWVIGRWPNKLFNLGSVFSIQYPVFSIPDVVFLPNLSFLPPIPKRTKLVVTVHDLSFEHFPDCFTVKQRLWHRFVRPRTLLERADAIIAVSETTKQDVVETYGIPEGKIHVVYPGIKQGTGNREQGTVLLAANLRSEIGDNQYILSLAEISPRKNLDGLIAAFEQLAAPLRLVIAGIAGSAMPAIRRQIARSPARDRIHCIGPVTEDEKHALLARASCFVYPSLWEGFGFPPLEARERGCPVVASTGGSLPEVLGDAALLVDPLDPAAIADAIHRVLTDEALRTNLIASGRERAAQYQWDRAAKQALGVITSVIS
jgi:glycosyltransferase involved in cell wall biosynthesis